MLYPVSANGRSVFYGTDTGTLPERTWQAFRNQKMRFGVVILDHTYGKDQVGSDPMSADEVVEHARRLQADGALTPNGRVFATHIAHEGNPPRLDHFSLVSSPS